MFDFAKNYARLIPLKEHSVDIFNGHLILAFIASAILKMIQCKLKTVDQYLGSRLSCMRNQKCTIYLGKIITDVTQKIVNDTYKAFKMVSIPIVNGRLKVDYYNDPAKNHINLGLKKAKPYV